MYFEATWSWFGHLFILVSTLAEDSWCLIFHKNVISLSHSKMIIGDPTRFLTYSNSNSWNGTIL